MSIVKMSEQKYIYITFLLRIGLEPANRPYYGKAIVFCDHDTCKQLNIKTTLIREIIPQLLRKKFEDEWFSDQEYYLGILSRRVEKHCGDPKNWADDVVEDMYAYDIYINDFTGDERIRVLSPRRCSLSDKK